MRRLEGKRAIVTGAGAGIGRAIALRMAEEGARVVLADVDEESAKKVAAELEGSSLVYSADVTRAEEVEALVRRAIEEWGGLDVSTSWSTTRALGWPRLRPRPAKRTTTW
jgi:NAD(P)-dependent dehydrogenase (short-subunit alcohol dehydrogenase family)